MCELRDQIWFGPESGIGKRMRHRRWMFGVTRQRLAEKIGVSLEMVETIEGGETAFRIGELSNIAIALDVPNSYFFDKTRGIDLDPWATKPTSRPFPVQDQATEIFTA